MMNYDFITMISDPDDEHLIFESGTGEMYEYRGLVLIHQSFTEFTKYPSENIDVTTETLIMAWVAKITLENEI